MFKEGDKVKLKPTYGGPDLSENKIYTVLYVIESLYKIKVMNDQGVPIMTESWAFDLTRTEDIINVDTKTGEVMKFKQVTNEAETKLMTQDEYLTMFQELQALQFNTTKKKNSDYTGGDTSDPFKNFRSSEAFGVSVEKGFMTRMSDKWMRLCGLISGHKPLVKESIEDTLLDMSTYCLLLICYLRGKK